LEVQNTDLFNTLLKLSLCIKTPNFGVEATTGVALRDSQRFTYETGPIPRSGKVRIGRASVVSKKSPEVSQIHPAVQGNNSGTRAFEQ
jgi:hypothetical protein